MKRFCAIIGILGIVLTVTVVSAESFVGPFTRSLPGWGEWTSYSS